MSLFKEEMDAGECVLLNMREFSAYTIKSKFPNVIDGLKPIHRRILITMHKNPSTAKEATVAGRVMEMHPHGDQSIADAISGLCQPFSNIVPLVESNSNIGTYVGDDPAAARYVDVREAELASDLFFKNTDPSTLKMIPCESEKGTEPANFVPVIPTALVFPVLGIGCGFKTETSAISFPNACIVARKFVELKYSDPDGYRKKAFALAKYLLPDFPTYCTLRNSDQIVREYRKGNFEVAFVLDGLMEMSKDSITIVTLPPDRSFGKVTHDAGKKTICDKTSWFHEHFQEMADLGGKKQGCTKGAYVCQLRRGENPFDVLTMLKRQLQFTSIWKPSMLFNDEEAGMSAETLLTLLDKWSSARYKVVLGGLKQKLIDLQKRYILLTALLIVADHAKEVCNLYIEAKNTEIVVPILVEKFGMTPSQARSISDLKLKQLTAKGKQELQEEIDEIKRKNNELQQKFTKVDQEIIANIAALEKKYAASYPAKCTVPTYIGTACYKETGWILLEDIKECDTILEKFGSEDIKFSLFQQAKGSLTVIGSDDPDKNPDVDPPKYIHASYVGQTDYPHKVLSITVKDGIVFVPPPSVTGLLDNNPVPVSDKCTLISKTEGRLLVSVTEKNTRASLNVQTPSVKDILYTSPLADDEVIVIHCNSKIPGVVNLDRVKGNAKISRSPVGKTTVLGVVRIGCPCMFSIPQEVATRTPIKHMYVKDLSQFVPSNSTVKLLLTKKTTTTGKTLAPYANRSAIFTIKD